MVVSLCYFALEYCAALTNYCVVKHLRFTVIVRGSFKDGLLTNKLQSGKFKVSVHRPSIKRAVLTYVCMFRRGVTFEDLKDM